ncbi:Phytochrome-like protein cph1 [Granulibacter bethesdensis]|nr:Phytochrome-like protein cph1 [Granulibacter bethesdensis]
MAATFKNGYPQMPLRQEMLPLTECDREPIHMPGAIQPHGFLIAVSRLWNVTHVSANIADYVPASASKVLGASLITLLPPETVHALRGAVQMLGSAAMTERLFGLKLHHDAESALYDFSIHIMADTYVIEAEPSVCGKSGGSDVSSTVRMMFGRLQQSRGIAPLFQEATRQIRALTGYDRVMIYRFAEDGSGEVVAESLRSGTESCLGLHYPATDIPHQARTLYERSWLRLIGDTEDQTCPLLSLPEQTEPLDMSLSTLRAVSPVHVQYLRNMGVVASASISILRSGQLWGLIACHAMRPLWLAADRRAVMEMFGQMFSLLLDSREGEIQQERDDRLRDLLADLLPALREQGGGGLRHHLAAIADMVSCDGVAVVLSGAVSAYQLVPSEAAIMTLVGLLDHARRGELYASARIRTVFPALAQYPHFPPGVLAVPLSPEGSDYLLFFRQETISTVTWAGNPHGGKLQGEDGTLSPRSSFAAWTETVEDQSLVWTATDVRIAANLRAGLMDILLRRPASGQHGGQQRGGQGL